MRSSAELRLEARAVMGRNLGRILLISLGYVGLTYLVEILHGQLTGMTAFLQKYSQALEAYAAAGGTLESLPALPEPPDPALLPSLLASLLSIALLALSGGYRGYHLRRLRGEEVGFLDIFPRLDLALRLVAVQLFTVVVTAVGFLLFVVPGVILAYRYRLAVYILHDHPELSALAAMRESGRLMQGQKMRLFRLDLSFIGWFLADAVLSALAAPVLSVWLTPYVELSRAAFYQELASADSFTV